MEKIIEPSEQTRIATVIGVESYIGKHMMKHLLEHNKMVYGYSQDKNFNFNAPPLIVSGQEKIPYTPAPIISDAIFICLDPNLGFETFAHRIKNICTQCLKSHYSGKIGFFSSGSIYLSRNGAISETEIVAPRTENDLALATGENLLSVLLYNKENETTPVVMRVGVPYADEIGMELLPGFVNIILAQAARHLPISIRCISCAKRSLIHISDLCESAILLLDSVQSPGTYNIPGEVLTIKDVAEFVALKYGVNYIENGRPDYDDEYFFAGDQHLDEKYFLEQVNFIRKYTFQRWLKQEEPI